MEKFLFNLEFKHDENYQNYQIWAVFKWGVEVIGKGLSLKDAEDEATKWIADNFHWCQKDGNHLWRKTK